MYIQKKLNNMKQIVIFLLICCISVACEDILDNRIDTELKPDQVFVNYERIRDFGYGVYTFIPEGFNRIDGSLLAAATDEAEHTDYSSDVQKYNLGAWNQYSNPDDCWAHYYRGIRMANIFLEGSTDYINILAKDTLSQQGKQEYQNQVNDIGWMRGEVRFLRAYFYFELIKRYGGVPLINEVKNINEELSISRSSFNDIIQFIAEECDAVKNNVRVEWRGFLDTETGRVTKGTVLALKSRALLYAASPLYNSGTVASKWEAAASAAAEIISMNKYILEGNYQNLFIAPLSYRSDEVIFSLRSGNQNFMERMNYPIGTLGGQSGTCPTHNLVDAYEKLAGWDAANPYEKRDPRLKMTVVVNNSSWNGRTVEIWEGGSDGKGRLMATRTGYYLKKFLAPNINLVNNVKAVYSWILFRYAEILLNYAEAMNEAYGPDDDPEGYGLTARQVVNNVRARNGVNMPPVVAADQTELREKIKHERRIELAFEEHRYWDVRRWNEAEATLGSSILGVSIAKNETSFEYEVTELENRVFENKMYLYPIPQVEIDKFGGVIQQNPNW